MFQSSNEASLYCESFAYSGVILHKCCIILTSSLLLSSDCQQVYQHFLTLLKLPITITCMYSANRVLIFTTFAECSICDGDCVCTIPLICSSMPDVLVCTKAVHCFNDTKDVPVLAAEKCMPLLRRNGSDLLVVISFLFQ